MSARHNGVVYRVPLARPGQILTASAWNSAAGAINGLLLPPRSRQQGTRGGRVMQVPLAGRAEYEGRIENPEDENQYVDVRRVGAIRIRITAEMLPLRAGDEWVISVASPTIPEGFDQTRSVYDDLPEGSVL